MLMITSRPSVMGIHVIGTRLRMLGWLATLAVVTTVSGMLVA